MSGKEPAYSLVFYPSQNKEINTVASLQKSLENGNDEEKIRTMKDILVTMLEGNPLPELLMHIIRFVMPSKDKRLKKLLYFYWEIVPKLNENGNLRHEMILVCNAIQHDLQHPNEYIRGSTLRFLTKLREAELLEQMVPSVLQCLEYRHAYVRKYAILAVLSIYKVSEHLLPDAKEIIHTFLSAETDPICKRNAFLGLCELDRELALQYLEENVANIDSLDPLLQVAFVDFIRKDATETPSLVNQYIDLLLDLLVSTIYPEVIFETALTLTTLSSNQNVLVKTCTKLIDLAVKVSDNNVKLILLDRIRDINDKNPGALEELTLDILRVLNTEDIDVREKVLSICMDLASSKNVEDVVQLLKKELQTTVNNVDKERSTQYRQLLIKTIRSVAVTYIDMAASVVSLLLDFIGDLNSIAATGVISFIKEVIERYPQLKSDILNHLLNALENVKSAKAYRAALWILGEFSETSEDIQSSWKHIRFSVGELPILQAELRKLSQNTEDEEKDGEENYESTKEAKKTTGPTILPDGTYAMESSFDTVKNSAESDKINEERIPPMRRFILKGDFYTSSVLASTILKLVLKFEKVSDDISITNALKAEALLILVSIVRYGQSNLTEKKIDEDSEERLLTGISILMDESNEKENVQENELLNMIFLDATRSTFKHQISLTKSKNQKKSIQDLNKNAAVIESVISFRQLSGSNVISEDKDSIKKDLELALKGENNISSQSPSNSSLKKIVQLTGFSDPVYAEAYVKNNQFDVVLDVLLVNQTKETLKNLHVQFATLGDLKIIDNPPKANVVPHGFHRLTVTVKVSSADTGVIFGNIIYDGAHGEDARYVIMNDLHIDIMDYIKPATTDDENFRTMWNEFEWENKISVKSHLSSLHDYLDTLTKGTNMGILTPKESLGEKDCRFLSCNLYAKSSFGEDALANLCIERDPVTENIIGYVRIRSKGQGLALSLGDRVAMISKQTNKVKVTRV